MVAAQINDKTSVPITWVGAMGVILAAAIFWVAALQFQVQAANTKLTLIEQANMQERVKILEVQFNSMQADMRDIKTSMSNIKLALDNQNVLMARYGDKLDYIAGAGITRK